MFGLMHIFHDYLDERPTISNTIFSKFGRTENNKWLIIMMIPIIVDYISMKFVWNDISSLL